MMKCKIRKEEITSNCNIPDCRMFINSAQYCNCTFKAIEIKKGRTHSGIGNFSVKEVADILNISIEDVKRAEKRGLEKLNKYLLKIN